MDKDERRRLNNISSKKSQQKIRDKIKELENQVALLELQSEHLQRMVDTHQMQKVYLEQKLAMHVDCAPAKSFDELLAWLDKQFQK